MGNNATKCSSLQGEDDVKIFTIVLTGDNGVGKSCILHRYHSDKFELLNYTVGYGFAYKTIFLDDKKIQLNIFDTAGHERYYPSYRFLYNTADGIVMVYDITRQETLQNLRNRWIKEIRENVETELPTIIVGSKCDLEYERTVQRSAVEKIRQDIPEIKYVIESSAKRNENIEFIFTWLAAEINKIKHNPTNSVPRPTSDTSENQEVIQNSKKLEKLSVTDSSKQLTTSDESEKNVASHEPINSHNQNP